MFKYMIVALAVVAGAAAAPGYLGGLGLASAPLLGHTGPALSLAPSLSYGHSLAAPAYASSAYALPAPITKYATAPAYSYAPTITKIATPAIAPISLGYKSYAAPAIAPLSLGYKSYAAPAISYSAPITKYATAPALSLGGLGHAW